jgi:hypothetical protein
MKLAYHEFVMVSKLQYPHWKVITYAPAIVQDTSQELGPKKQSPIDFARQSSGKMATHSLIALLMVLESRYLVLTPASNWSRLIDELHDWLWSKKSVDIGKHINVDRIYLWGEGENPPGVWMDQLRHPESYTIESTAKFQCEV